MDEIDFIILKKLIENSRVTYRELAEIIGMSITTIHKRMKSLVDDGIINNDGDSDSYGCPDPDIGLSY